MKRKEGGKSGEVSQKEEAKPIIKAEKPKTADEYHAIWSKMTVDFTSTQPILAMCCSKAEKFELDKETNTLKIWFSSDANMLLLEDEKNKKYVLSKLLFEGDDVKVEYFALKEEVSDVDDKIKRIKALFNDDILKITKK